ncbi:hypothetical protein UFOVP1146_194 [uncultured Caudovirales phage]|uniref:Uncharacterized protein n=1 Tax=uncultured Caudovirales phage TaxID=2100421 RepID=A0A6J5P0U9_9CAUD|nr:hypothetical protein UFOVP812_107 [uncultured Caudovirales phage]CAB4165439.1 hypothetical protein UFOVP818_36 [uncultured Caudovirales phage]CAB4186848.1 hypothetical protein UFOVP1146_194 [uncultured Caudovirales phage]CAB4221540.1 hypothetical protein UFOVP1638_371 [uncultured Caudovirales phage]
MNERIKEIAVEAGAVVYGCGQSIDYGTLDLDVERFAKLLLDEFIEALEESNGTHSETSGYGLSILVGDIKRHFGVAK